MKHWECGLYQVCTNDESSLALTYLMARSNLIPNACILKNHKMFIFSITVKAESIILSRNV